MMAIRVVDTDIWSYLYKGRDESKLAISSAEDIHAKTIQAHQD